MEGAYDILGKGNTRKQYDKDAKEAAAEAKVGAEKQGSQAEITLSGLATSDTGKLSLDDLKAAAEKVTHLYPIMLHCMESAWCICITARAGTLNLGPVMLQVATSPL